MTLHRLGLICVALILLAPPSYAADYVIDTKGGHASINFRIQHLGFSWLTGRFNTFAGTFRYDEADPSSASISVTVDTASIDSNHAERDKHLRNADYLAAGAFPQATFVSTSVKPEGQGKAMITGDFTLRGIIRPVTIAAEYVGGGADPWGGFRQGFIGKTELILADFGIVKELGPASKKVELEFHLEGARK